MLQVARLAPRLLGDSADRVRHFLFSQLHASGGFLNRAGEPDLYYTVFGLEGLAALQIEPPATDIAAYLRTFGDGANLDLVHLCCLARCWADLSTSGFTTALRAASPPERLRPPPSTQGAVPGAAAAPGRQVRGSRESGWDPTSNEKAGGRGDWCNTVAQRIQDFRAADGGYHREAGAPHGSVYGAFLALGAYEDLRLPLPDAEGVLRAVRRLVARDGGYANVAAAQVGSTPATAAAVMLLRHLDEEPDSGLVDWLLARCRPDGGFFAAPAAPMPDLLSTATAIHALVAMHAPIEAIKEPCLDFIDSLWTSQGAFHGSWADDALDCEYTFYGLLALGHLSL